jgi:hypothetical protein
MPLPGVTKAAKYIEPGSVVCRNITPALAHELLFDCETTWALTLPSAAKDWETKWNWSAVPQISLPEAVTVQVPPFRL